MELELQDGTIMDIPDDMPREQIRKVIANYNDSLQKPHLRNNPQSVPPAPETMPGMDALKYGVQGAGQGLTFGFMDELTGAVETPLRMAGVVGDDATIDPGKAYRQGRDASRRRYAEAKQAAPYITGSSQVLSSIAPGTALFNLMKPATLLGSASLGGTEGGLYAYGQSHDTESLLEKGLFDTSVGALTAGAGFGATELFKRINRARKLKPSVRSQQADELGLKLTPAQRYEDPALHRVEAAMQSDPGYGSSFDALKTHNQTLANRIAARTLGIEADKLTDVELGHAARQISKRFNDAKESGMNIALDDDWLNDLVNLSEYYTKAWGRGREPLPAIEDALTATTKGYLTPEEFQRQYSALGKQLSQANSQGDGILANVYRGMRESLSSALDRGYPGKSEGMQMARDLYKAQILLEKPGVLRTETGNVSPLILGNKLRSFDKHGYMHGENKSDLYNLARVAQNYKSGIGDSGTATRSKGFADYLMAPTKERMGEYYMSGNLGHSLMGPGAGGGISNKLNPAYLEIMRLLEEDNNKR